jgi:N-acetylmuramoyl-L-alanine amidase
VSRARRSASDRHAIRWPRLESAYRVLATRLGLGRESLERTKLRLIREAVRHNVAPPPRLPARTAAHRQPVLVGCLVGSLLTVGFAYLSPPGPVVSRGMASPPDAHRVEPAPPPARVEAPLPEAPIAETTPRRLTRAVLPLAVKKVVLDPGHGGRQHGAISESGVSEKDITLDIALRLRRFLQGTPLQVLMTRERDETLPLDERVRFANASDADLFVSIHVNWLPRRQVRPLETYYVGPTDDPGALRLASVENQASGYSWADYRRLLEKLYIDVRRDESSVLARTVNAELYRTLSRINPALKNLGVKTAPFVVLMGTQMPAILAEVSSLSNEQDVELLREADYRDMIAVALMRGIRSYVETLNDVTRKGG